MLRAGALALATSLSIAAAVAAPRIAKPGPPQLAGMIHEIAVSEISGAAFSRHDPKRLFAVNDSQNAAALYAIAADGSVLARTAVDGATNRDWEDLAGFELDGRPYLLIADTGDNGGLRESLSLLVVAEPEWPLPPSVNVEWRIDFKLPEGPRDIEAVSVDARAGFVYLVAKRHFPRVLYRLPLRAAGSGMQTATNLGVFNTLPPANDVEKSRDPRFGRFHGDVTSLALDPRGRFALVLSYRDLYFYARSGSESWLKTFRRKPTRMHLPPMPQPESVALDAAANEALVFSEGILAPVYRVTLPVR
jgi:hypothetical protein